jgi:hypothetical protein
LFSNIDKLRLDRAADNFNGMRASVDRLGETIARREASST